MGSFEYASIFSSAEASASGFPAISDPVLSAPNSRVHNIAIRIIIDANGAAIKAIMKYKWCVFRFLFPPPHKTLLDIKDIVEASIAAILETRMSLFFMCEISCAKTPSSSSLFNTFKIPVVTAILAFFGFLPVANALG